MKGEFTVTGFHYEEIASAYNFGIMLKMPDKILKDIQNNEPKRCGKGTIKVFSDIISITIPRKRVDNG